MLQQQRAEAVDLVVDAVLAQRPPVDTGIDREYGLFEPELGDPRQPCHRQSGADLDHCIDARSVDFPDGIAKLALTHMRDQYGPCTFKALEPHDLEPAIREEPPDLRVAGRHLARTRAQRPRRI